MPTRGQRTRGAVLAAAALLPLLSGCASHTRVVYVPAPPPPPVVEVVTVQPSAQYVWIDGHHTWNGSAYLWVSGRWVLRPNGRTRYVPGHWEHGRGGWYWLEGHWR